MAASQVVLYFDKQEDALLFTLAASSVISSEAPVRAKEALVKIADEIRKAGAVQVSSARVRLASVEVEIPFERPGLGLSRSTLDALVACGARVKRSLPGSWIESKALQPVTSIGQPDTAASIHSSGGSMT